MEPNTSQEQQDSQNNTESQKKPKKQHKNANVMKINQEDLQKMQENQENNFKFLNTDFLQKITSQIEPLNLQYNEKSNIFMENILGTIQAARSFIQKPKKQTQNNSDQISEKKLNDDDNNDDVVFIQTIDQENKCMLRCILQKSNLKQMEKIQAFYEFVKMLKTNTLLSFSGHIGLQAQGLACIYISDFNIIKIQPQFTTALNWIHLFSKDYISQETTTTALQIQQYELKDLIKIGGEQIIENKFQKGGKKENILKKRLIEITRQLQSIPINRVSLRPPQYPDQLFNIIQNYEKKYGTLEKNSVYIKNQEISDNNENIQQIGQKLDQENQGQNSFIKQNIPDQKDQQRLKYINEKKIPQVDWFCKYLEENIIPTLQNNKNKKQLKVLDIGGGRGDLALSIAHKFSEINITVIDINQTSLSAGEKLANKMNIQNIKFECIGVEEITQKYQEKKNQENKESEWDLVVGLHTCGGLAEAILNFCLQECISFFICTCCFSSNPSLIPAKFSQMYVSQQKQNLDCKQPDANINQPQYNNNKIEQEVFKNQMEKDLLCKYSEQHFKYEIAEQCMSIVNNARLETFRKLFQNNSEKSDYNWGEVTLKMVRFDKQFSLKNFVLEGIIRNS